jgi:hypothetical protein
MAAQKLKDMAGLDSPAWVFLGRSYAQQRHWTVALEGVAEHLPLNGRLQQVASQMKMPYLELIAELGRKLQSDAWWASRISERNTLISHLFLYCCYLRIARQLQEEHQGDLIVVSESWALLDALDDWARSGNAMEIRWLGRGWRGLEYARYLAHAINQVLRLALAFVQSRLWGMDNPPPKQELFLLHTYLEDACFGPEHRFRERYFPGLSAWLESQGYTVAVLPAICNVSLSYRNVWKWLRRSDTNFINCHRYCRLSDYAHALAQSWRSACLPFTNIELNGLDVTRLFVEERRRTAFSVASFLLYLRLPLRLRQHGISVREVVVEHENMIPEKLLTIGFRRHMPATKILGYQHSGLYPLLLCSQVISEEAAIAPLPDRVLCNGRYYRDILRDIGMPEQLLTEGPALRHTHLARLCADDADSANNGCARNWDVLVLLPMMKSDAAELLLKTIEALAIVPVQRVGLKPHPMLSQSVLLREAGLDKLPSAFSFVTGDLGQLLHDARVVVCMSSTAILEVAAAGVKMVVVGRESALDFNPLGFLKDSPLPVILVSELTDQLEASLQVDRGHQERLNQFLIANVADFFNPPNAAMMANFII